LSASAARREAKIRASLVAAYREGLGLAGLAAVRGAAGTQIAVVGDERDRAAAGVGDTVTAQWWCRRAADAERVATAATARLRRLESQDDAALPPAAERGASPRDIAGVIAHAAKRLHVKLYSDEEISADAQTIIMRVEQELETLQRAGQLKTVNRSYRTYRTEASARGEKALPYADWFNKYRANLVRQLAAALRYV
jgi:hypothetical protein